jgi:hypothetical protein
MIAKHLNESLKKQMQRNRSNTSRRGTRVVKKVMAPSPSPALDAKVSNPNQEIAHLIDVFVFSKYGSDIINGARTITQLVSKFEKFETSLPHKVGSFIAAKNDENSGKNLVPLDSSGCLVICILLAC